MCASWSPPNTLLLTLWTTLSPSGVIEAAFAIFPLFRFIDNGLVYLTISILLIRPGFLAPPTPQLHIEGLFFYLGDDNRMGRLGWHVSCLNGSVIWIRCRDVERDDAS